VRVIVPHNKFSNKGSYDFAIFSAYFAAPCTKKNPCVDVIPNRYPLIRHDFMHPKVKWVSVPAYPTDASSTLSPVQFGVTDDPLGSGVKSWTLQRRVLGTSSWVDVKSGSSLSPVVQVLGVEGPTFELRVKACDRQGNESPRPGSTSRTHGTIGTPSSSTRRLRC
jgi:hypothetical protein